MTRQIRTPDTLFSRLCLALESGFVDVWAVQQLLRGLKQSDDPLMALVISYDPDVVYTLADNDLQPAAIAQRAPVEAL